MHELQTHCGPYACQLFYQRAATGREAVRNCLVAFGASRGLPLTPEDIINHTHLSMAPAIKVSVSHSRTLGVLAVCDTAELAGIGVDVEMAARSLRPGVAARILNADDDPDLADDPLGLWVRKEAAFKALAPLLPASRRRPLLVTDVWLRGDVFGLTGEATPRGGLCVIGFESEGEAVRGALAWVPVGRV